MIQTFAPPLAVLAAFGGLFAYASWRAAKPADPLNPRMIPWRTLSVLAGFLAMLALIYLVSQFRSGAS